MQDEGADLPFAPPMKGDLYLVPNGVRPVMQRTAVEVTLHFACFSRFAIVSKRLTYNDSIYGPR